MSKEDERTIMEETARLMNLIESIEEKIRVSEVKMTETETIALDRAKLRLSELEKADAKELQRIINDSIEKSEGLFPKEAFKEIKKEE
jgi:uncharacterized lipoprotein YehR (DUF1307 family)